jgi:hypothetical protein
VLWVLFRDARQRGLALRPTILAICIGLLAGTMLLGSHRAVATADNAAQPPIRVDLESLRRVG